MALPLFLEEEQSHRRAKCLGYALVHPAFKPFWDSMNSRLTFKLRPATRPWERIWRSSVVHLLIGLTLGVVVAALLVAVSLGFPRFKEFSRDLGLAVSVAWERIDSVSAGGIELRAKEQFGYAFVDLDPQPDGVSPQTPYEQACLAKRPPSTPASDCDPRYPINRHLLAEVVTKVKAQGAKLVVIDVLLEKSSQDSAGEADKALTRAVSRAQVVYPAPVIDIAESAQPGAPVALFAAGQTPALATTTARAAVPYPVADQPIRRYARCFFESGSNQLIGSLPFAAVQSLAGATPSPQTCLLQQPPQRIVYTLPSLAVEKGANVERLAGLYRQVMVRCSVEHLWNTDDGCGLGNAFEGRIVVIGSSHPLRKDRHFTPLGDMAGAEVVINAIRSFTLYPLIHEHSSWEKFVGKCWVVAKVSLLVWLPFYLFICWREERRSRSALMGMAFIGESVLRFAAFAAAVLFALIASLWLAAGKSETPDVDILLPVAAVALEVVIEAAAEMRHALEHWLERVMGLAVHKEAH